MRALWLIVVGACRSTPTAAPPSNVRTTVAPKTATVVENCESASNGFKPGNHDRYSFEDPKTTKWGFKDKSGKLVIPAIYEHVYEFSPSGLAGVVAPAKDGTPFLFLDPSGKAIARVFAFDNGPDYFQEGYARIVDDQKRMGFIDETGKIAIAPKFVFASPFCHGKSEVELDEGTYFIDRQGNKTTAPPPDTGT